MLLSKLFKKKSNILLVLAFDKNGVAVVQQDKSSQQLAAFYLQGDKDKIYSLLSQQVEEYKLKNAEVVICLPPEDYLLVQTEKPNVPDEELNNAVLWGLSDLIPWDINEVTIDTFDFPQSSYSQVKNINVVVCRDQVLQYYIDLCRELELEIVKITVVESSLTGVLQGEKHDTYDSLICVLIYPDNIFISVLYQNVLYLSRKMEIGEKIFSGVEPDIAEQGHYEHITLDVQRSLDYFESTFSFGGVRYCLLFPDNTLTQYLSSFLKQSIAAEILNLQQIDTQWEQLLKEQNLTARGSLLVALANIALEKA